MGHDEERRRARCRRVITFNITHPPPAQTPFRLPHFGHERMGNGSISSSCPLFYQAQCRNTLCFNAQPSGIRARGTARCTKGSALAARLRSHCREAIRLHSNKPLPRTPCKADQWGRLHRYSPVQHKEPVGDSALPLPVLADARSVNSLTLSGLSRGFAWPASSVMLCDGRFQ